MAVNPTQWLSSTLAACCTKFFLGYSYEICMKLHPRDDDDCRTGAFAANSSRRRDSLDGDTLRQARESALRAFLCKCCSAFESFSHAKFCARLIGQDISPGLIGLSGIVSSSLVLYAKWPDDK